MCCWFSRRLDGEVFFLLWQTRDKSEQKIHREILKLYEFWSVTVDDPCQYETLIPEFLSWQVGTPSKPWSYRQAAFFSNALGCEAALCTSDQQLVLLRRSGAHLRSFREADEMQNADMRCEVLIIEVLLELILVCSLTSSFALHFCFQLAIRRWLHRLSTKHIQKHIQDFKPPSDLHESMGIGKQKESLSHFVSDFLHLWNPDFWPCFSGTTVPVAIQNPRMRASVVLTTLWQLSRCGMPWRERFSSLRWMRCRVPEGLCLADQATASEWYIFVYGDISRFFFLTSFFLMSNSKTETTWAVPTWPFFETC